MSLPAVHRNLGTNGGSVKFWGAQGCANGASRPTVFLKLQESWSKVSHAARELATVYFMWPFFSNNNLSIGQNTPKTEGISAQHWIYM